MIWVQRIGKCLKFCIMVVADNLSLLELLHYEYVALCTVFVEGVFCLCAALLPAVTGLQMDQCSSWGRMTPAPGNSDMVPTLRVG